MSIQWLPKLRPTPPARSVPATGELRNAQGRLNKAISSNQAKSPRFAPQIRSAEINLRHLQGNRSVGTATIAHAAEACLLRSGRPMRVIEMVPLLQQEGNLMRSDSAYSTLFRTLSPSKDRFRHVHGKRGYWDLNPKLGSGKS